MSANIEVGVLATKVFDVIICGCGLAGLTLARQLRREFPDLEILAIDKTARPLPDACHKVGESSVELGSQYLERLGLTDYLLEHHIIKFGLRFFPGGGNLPLEQRTEIGPPKNPIVRSYQLDRGRLEQDLRAMVELDGVVLLEGATVRRTELAGQSEPHAVIVGVGEQDIRIQTRWIVDATGRRALMRREQKLERDHGHHASAGWFRVQGKVDITEMVGREEVAWHRHRWTEERWRSTNHFMGEGYWVWVIPLAGGRTSIGAVVHTDTHSFDDVRTLDRTLGFIAKHEPQLAKFLEQFEVLDFLCLGDYSNGVERSWSADRWAIVGVAGAFVDPLYSPGTDFIAIANTFTTELIRVDREGGDLETRVRELDTQYRELVDGNVNLFRRAAPIYGHARAMAAKVYWDNFAYWNYPCQYFLQGIYRLSGAAHQPFLTVGGRFLALGRHAQDLIRGWARLAPNVVEPGFIAMPDFPSVLVDSHIDLQKSMSADKTLEYMQLRAQQGEEIIAELVIRVVQELGVEVGAELLDSLGAHDWRVRIDPARLDAEAGTGMTRRRALSAIARDVERTLGPVRRHETAAEGRTLLLERFGPLERRPV